MNEGLTPRGVPYTVIQGTCEDSRDLLWAMPSSPDMLNIEEELMEYDRLTAIAEQTDSENDWLCASIAGWFCNFEGPTS